jgi:hypothetical protein
MSLVLVSALFCSAVAAVQGPPSLGAEGEPRCWVPVLRNGDFTLPVFEGAPGVPWWRTRSGAPQVVAGGPRVGGGEAPAELRLPAGTLLQQPLAVWAGAARELRLRGLSRGQFTLTLIDGGGGFAHEQFVAPLATPLRPFEADAGALEDSLQRALVPRFVLQLYGAAPGDAVGEGFVAELAAEASLPCPSEADLRRELLELLDWSFDQFLTRGLDDLGPRATAFVAHDFDVDRGERIGSPSRRVTYHPLYGQLLEAWHCEPRPQWEAALVRFVEDFLELGLHPATGLPRFYDPVEDRPLDDLALEIRVHFEFLLDLAEHGPTALRERCLAAATRIGETVLARGVWPDGSVAARYTPSSGAASLDTPPIRRLDVPAALGRLSKLGGDPRFLDVAREAVLELEYDHYWPGTWERIDPGFDDNYGHYGERAIALWEAHPQEPSFRHLALSGYEHYAPLLRQALRHGGNVAADQVRCWRIFARIAALLPERAAEIGGLLEEAAHLHFTGQQVAGGHWIDVTVIDFDPQRLPVGDTAGVPQNLLEGLGALYREDLGLATEAHRARYTAVLRTTLQVFGGAHGLIATASRADGRGADNSAVGSLRFHPGLIAMLVHLPADPR